LNDENSDINVIDVVSSDYLNETIEDKPVKVSNNDEKVFFFIYY
jgi:alpha-D-ribose 1-methylphosphonate 5-triphosphate diphosphatase PhnM